MPVELVPMFVKLAVGIPIDDLVGVERKILSSPSDLSIAGSLSLLALEDRALRLDEICARRAAFRREATLDQVLRDACLEGSGYGDHVRLSPLKRWRRPVLFHRLASGSCAIAIRIDAQKRQL